MLLSGNTSTDETDEVSQGLLGVLPRKSQGLLGVL
jgi:hypothetical protein